MKKSLFLFVYPFLVQNMFVQKMPSPKKLTFLAKNEYAVHGWVLLSYKYI